MEEEVLYAAPIFKGRRWEGTVEVARFPRAGGPVISLRVRIGRHFLPLPRHGLEELCNAILEGGKVASRFYSETIKRKP